MRTALKHELGRFAGTRPGRGATVLTYHRVGGGSPDERDVTSESFAAQLAVLQQFDVVSLDDATARLVVGDDSPCIVLTFDDGFADVHANAWPLMRDRQMPFTLYLATGYLGGRMAWEGSTARADGPALTWGQVEEMAGSGLCTIGNHTHNHVPPHQLTVAELDACTEAIEQHPGIVPRHFAHPWGIPVHQMEGAMQERFRTAVTGVVGRNSPGQHLLRVKRVPVRRTDPLEFFKAKLTGRLIPERAYGAVVAAAKKAGI